MLAALLVASVSNSVGSEIAGYLFLLTSLTRFLLLAFQLCRSTCRTGLRNPWPSRRFRGSLSFATAFVDIVAGSMPLQKIARPQGTLVSGLRPIAELETYALAKFLLHTKQGNGFSLVSTKCKLDREAWSSMGCG